MQNWLGGIGAISSILATQHANLRNNKRSMHYCVTVALKEHIQRLINLFRSRNSIQNWPGGFGAISSILTTWHANLRNNERSTHQCATAALKERIQRLINSFRLKNLVQNWPGGVGAISSILATWHANLRNNECSTHQCATTAFKVHNKWLINSFRLRNLVQNSPGGVTTHQRVPSHQIMK